MELTLLETKRRTKTKTLLGVGATSLTLHTAGIAAAVYATLSARPADSAVRIDTSVVLLAPTQRQPATPPPVQLAHPLSGLQTLTVLTALPAPDSQLALR